MELYLLKKFFLVSKSLAFVVLRVLWIEPLLYGSSVLLCVPDTFFLSVVYFINCFYSLDIIINRNDKCSQSPIHSYTNHLPIAWAVSCKYSRCCCSSAGFFPLIFLHHHTDFHVTRQSLYWNLYGFALLQFHSLKTLCILAKKNIKLIWHNLSLVTISPIFMYFCMSMSFTKRVLVGNLDHPNTLLWITFLLKDRYFIFYFFNHMVLPSVLVNALKLLPLALWTQLLGLLESRALCPLVSPCIWQFLFPHPFSWTSLGLPLCTVALSLLTLSQILR